PAALLVQARPRSIAAGNYRHAESETLGDRGREALDVRRYYQQIDILEEGAFGAAVDFARHLHRATESHFLDFARQRAHIAGASATRDNQRVGHALLL